MLVMAGPLAEDHEVLDRFHSVAIGSSFVQQRSMQARYSEKYLRGHQCIGDRNKKAHDCRSGLVQMQECAISEQAGSL